MNILVCAKRVPDTGAKIMLTDDEQSIETRNLGFTISPHEECAIEEAVQLVEAHGGTAVGLILGPAAAEQQLRDGLARGLNSAVLIDAGESEWGPMSTALAIEQTTRELEEEGGQFDLLLFGNEAADSGDYQVGIRVAQALGRPCATGIKDLEIMDGVVSAKREIAGGWEVFELPLPAVLTVREGINLPRYPSLRGRMVAKKAEVKLVQGQRAEDGLRKLRLKKPPEQESKVEVLGEGVEAAERVVALLRELEILDS